jgi:hypothetical protein
MEATKHDPALLESVRRALKAKERRLSENAKLNEEIAVIDEEVSELRNQLRSVNGDLKDEVEQKRRFLRAAEEDESKAEEMLRRHRARARDAAIRKRGEIPLAPAVQREPLPASEPDEAEQLLLRDRDGAKARVERARSKYEEAKERLAAADRAMLESFQTLRSNALDAARRGDVSVVPSKFEEARKLRARQLEELIADANKRRARIAAKLITTPHLGDEDVAAMGEWLTPQLKHPDVELLALLEAWCVRTRSHQLAGATYRADTRTITISLGNAPRSAWIDEVIAAAQVDSAKTSKKEAA